MPRRKGRGGKGKGGGGGRGTGRGGGGGGGGKEEKVLSWEEWGVKGMEGCWMKKSGVRFECLLKSFEGIVSFLCFEREGEGEEGALFLLVEEFLVGEKGDEKEGEKKVATLEQKCDVGVLLVHLLDVSFRLLKGEIVQKVVSVLCSLCLSLEASSPLYDYLGVFAVSFGVKHLLTIGEEEKAKKIWEKNQYKGDKKKQTYTALTKKKDPEWAKFSHLQEALLLNDGEFKSFSTNVKKIQSGLSSPPGGVRSFVTGKRGVGLMATKSFSKGDVIFTEKPLFCSQKAENRETVVSCDHCLRFLGLRSKFNPEKAMLCPNGCGFVFCSEDCLSKTNKLYHSNLCQSKNGENLRELVMHSDQTSGRATLASIILTESLSSESLGNKRGWVGDDWRDLSIYDPISKTTEKQAAQRQGANFKELKTYVLADSLNFFENVKEDGRGKVSLAEYSKVFGVIDQNAAVVEAFPGPQQRKALLKAMPSGQKSLEDLPHVLGSALFLYHSCLNHSCAPNAMVKGGLLSELDARVQIVALSNIDEGEELFISYIDEQLPKRERQLSLLCAYNFKCCCSLCLPPQ